jgi:hypothetical protein
MSFKIPAKSGNFQIAPEGTHLALCNAIIDLGMQPGSQMYPAAKHQVYLRFEIPGETVSYESDGKEVTGPIVVGATFTASMGKKAKLRQFIEGWFAKGFPSDEAASDFDLTVLLGKAGLLTITHNQSGDRTYANVKSAAPLIKGMEKPALHNKPIAFFIEQWDDKEFSKVPEWLQKKIETRLRTPDEVQQSQQQIEMDDDNIPF